MLAFLVVVPSIELSVSSVALAATKSHEYTDYNTPFFQELSAKRWLLKHRPVGPEAFGMPRIDARTKKQKLREQRVLAQAAKNYVNTHPEVATFLGKQYGATNEEIYQTIQMMDLIQLTKTDTGYMYHLQGGGLCFIQDYTGTLTMNGNVVTDDVSEMHLKGVPC